MGWLDAVPWLVAVFGWLVTHLFSEARERRKEARAKIDKFLERASGIETASRNFHLGAVFDEQQADALLADLDRLDRASTRLPGISSDSLVAMIIHHRRAITLSNFDASSFCPQTRASEILADIASSTADLEDELELQYAQRYPNRFPYFTMREFKRGERI